MLRTERFLMDQMSGQFYAIYGNSFQHMSTRPRLDEPWEKAELLDELAETRHAFGYAGLAGPTLAQQIPQPVHQQPTPKFPLKMSYQDLLLPRYHHGVSHINCQHSVWTGLQPDS